MYFRLIKIKYINLPFASRRVSSRRLSHSHFAFSGHLNELLGYLAFSRNENDISVILSHQNWIHVKWWDCRSIHRMAGQIDAHLSTFGCIGMTLMWASWNVFWCSSNPHHRVDAIRCRSLGIPNLFILRIERSRAELLLRFTHGKYKSGFPFRSTRKYMMQANDDANVVCFKLFHHLEILKLT